MGLDLSIAATGVSWGDNALTIRPPARVQGDDRLAFIVEVLAPLLEAGHPDLVVVEDLPTGLRNAAAGSLGMVHGVVRLALIHGRYRYLTVTPATLKVYATGRGTAPKPDLRMELYKRTGRDVPDDNQVDATWLQLLGLDLLGTPTLPLPQTHRRALAKLNVPAQPGPGPDDQRHGEQGLSSASSDAVGDHQTIGVGAAPSEAAS